MRENTLIAITPQQVEGAEAKFVTYKASNESIVGIGFYDVGKKRIASRNISLASDKELSEENILAAIGVKIPAAQQVAPQPAK